MALGIIFTHKSLSFNLRTLSNLIYAQITFLLTFVLNSSNYISKITVNKTPLRGFVLQIGLDGISE